MIIDKNGQGPGSFVFSGTYDGEGKLSIEVKIHKLGPDIVSYALQRIIVETAEQYGQIIADSEPSPRRRWFRRSGT